MLVASGMSRWGEFSENGAVVDPLYDQNLQALLETGQICNHAQIVQSQNGWTAIGSPTEAAFITLAQKAGVQKSHRNVVCEFSFNSFRKRMSVVEECDDELRAHIKGAPEVLLARADKILIDGIEQNLDDAIRADIEAVYHSFAQQGLRTLALARKTMSNAADTTEESAETNITFLGIAGIIDPPRSEAKEAIAKTREAGIRVLMVTGRFS